MPPRADPLELSADDLDAVVAGVSLLGSGGGGDAATFAHLLRRRLAGGTLPLHPVEHVADGGFVVPIGVVGATSVFTEKLPSGHEFVSSVAALRRWTSRDVAAVMALEAGGLNGMSAMVAALDLGLPLLDADLMGRALPRLDQLAFAVEGLPVTPCAVCEPGGQTLIVDGVDAVGLERTVRAFLAEAGGWAVLALPPTPAELVRAHAVVGSLGRALGLGRAHAALPGTPTAGDIEAALEGVVLATGRVLDVARLGPARAFGRGSVTVVAVPSGAVVRVEAENEYLLALRDGAVAASTPDLICLLDRRTTAPIAVDRVRVGDEVVVAVLPGPAWWTSPHRLVQVAPRAFGLDCEPALLGGHA
ncbi:MAG: DUF917 domain-containing protein [Actinomycetota bacterium]